MNKNEISWALDDDNTSIDAWHYGKQVGIIYTWGMWGCYIEWDSNKEIDLSHHFADWLHPTEGEIILFEMIAKMPYPTQFILDGVEKRTSMMVKGVNK